MKKGFTLIELMIIVAIISILSSITLPKFKNSIKKSKDTRVLAVLSSYRGSMSIIVADKEGEFPINIDAIKNRTTKSSNIILEDGITNGKITSYQIKAGTVNKSEGTVSIGKDAFAGEKNIAEIYYNNSTGHLWVDGTTGSGVDFLDTKENKWNEY